MQKLITLIIVCFLTLGAGAQTTSKPKIGSSNSLDSLVQLGSQMNTILMAKEELNGRYKLYKTENIYTFLKLNTANGILSQIQWSTSDNEGTVDFLNTEDLTDSGAAVPGRFELYPTQNMYAFLLIDTWNGHTWHVQWNINSSNRGIWRIY